MQWLQSLFRSKLFASRLSILRAGSNQDTCLLNKRKVSRAKESHEMSRQREDEKCVNLVHFLEQCSALESRPSLCRRKEYLAHASRPWLTDFKHTTHRRRKDVEGGSRKEAKKKSRPKWTRDFKLENSPEYIFYLSLTYAPARNVYGWWIFGTNNILGRGGKKQNLLC